MVISCFSCEFVVQCSDRDVLGGWSDSGSIFMVDVGAKESDINLLKGRISQCP